MTIMLEQYIELLNLDKEVRFSKIDHDDAMVADVYKVESLEKPCFVLKICKHGLEIVKNAQDNMYAKCGLKFGPFTSEVRHLRESLIFGKK